MGDIRIFLFIRQEAHMKIVIVGGGKVGFAIASQTAREGTISSLVESDRERWTGSRMPWTYGFAWERRQSGYPA